MCFHLTSFFLLRLCDPMCILFPEPFESGPATLRVPSTQQCRRSAQLQNLFAFTVTKGLVPFRRTGKWLIAPADCCLAAKEPRADIDCSVNANVRGNTLSKTCLRSNLRGWTETHTPPCQALGANIVNQK